MFCRKNAVVCILVQNYLDHKVGKSAAALAYYLLFALFPLLIFVSSLLGRLNLDVNLIARELTGVLPAAIVGLMTDYLEYVTAASSDALMWFSLVFSVWFPMRAAGGLMDDVRRARGLGRPARPVVYRVRQFLFTLVLLVAVALTLVLSTLGRRALEYLMEIVPAIGRLNLPAALPAAWQYVRFLPVGVIMFLMLATLYGLSQEKRQPLRQLMPGVLGALVAWLAVSAGFSFYADHFANYSLIYGALGAVIALLVWLYLTALILIMGAELNAALHSAGRGGR